MIDIRDTIDRLRADHPERFKWAVVQIMFGEALNSVGPFNEREEAEAWVTQHREEDESAISAAFFVIPQVIPDE